jgi:hypothetical protein
MEVKIRNSRKARAVSGSSPSERLGEAKDPTVQFESMREQKKAKEWK